MTLPADPRAIEFLHDMQHELPKRLMAVARSLRQLIDRGQAESDVIASRLNELREILGQTERLVNTLQNLTTQNAWTSEILDAIEENRPLDPIA